MDSGPSLNQALLWPEDQSLLSQRQGEKASILSKTAATVSLNAGETLLCGHGSHSLAILFPTGHGLLGAVRTAASHLGRYAWLLQEQHPVPTRTTQWTTCGPQTHTAVGSPPCPLPALFSPKASCQEQERHLCKGEVGVHSGREGICPGQAAGCPQERVPQHWRKQSSPSAQAWRQRHSQ